MPLNETALGVLCAERLKLPRSAGLGFQTYIGSALNNLALDTVNDAQKRRWLITDPSATTASVAGSNGQYYVDLSTLLTDPQIMIDYLNYGTIYVTPPTRIWSSVNVNTTNNTIAITSHGYETGTIVRLSTDGTLPSPLVINTTYYLIALTADLLQVATSLTNAVAGTAIDLASTGVANSTMTPYGAQPVLQWLTSPNQGQLTSAVPIPYPTGWLVDTKIYLNNVLSGTLNFAVPFVPTLSNLPDFLQNDVLDQITDLAIAGGQELPKSSAER